MSANTKKRTATKEVFAIRIGNKYISVEPLPIHQVAKANAQIQKKVQPVLNQIKKTRKAAAITASKIILSA